MLSIKRFLSETGMFKLSLEILFPFFTPLLKEVSSVMQEQANSYSCTQYQQFNWPALEFNFCVEHKLQSAAAAVMPHKRHDAQKSSFLVHVASWKSTVNLQVPEQIKMFCWTRSSKRVTMLISVFLLFFPIKIWHVLYSDPMYMCKHPLFLQALNLSVPWWDQIRFCSAEVHGRHDPPFYLDEHDFLQQVVS